MKLDTTTDTGFIDPELLKQKGVGYTINTPEYSNWACYMYGSKKSDSYKTIYHPKKGQEPNRFVRYMMKICLGCTWIKD